MTNQQDVILTSVQSGILEIKLNRSSALNALNADLMMNLYQLLLNAKEDNTIRGLLITGEGKAFCAGADINQLAKLNSQTGVEFARFGQHVFRTLEELGKPSLAAVNGFALGGGCELAMSATFRIAAENAQFGQPEVKLGVIPGFGGTQRLSRLVGKGRALDLCLSGKIIKASEAQQIGLVSEVVANDNLLTHAREYLKSIIKFSPSALKSIMATIDRGYDLSLDDAMAFEAAYFGLCCATKDKKEGVTAFLEKRTAEFTGE